MHCIHLWNECWRQSKIDKSSSQFHPDSLYEQLKRRSQYSVLFLVDRKTFLTKMSRVRFHGIKALSKLVKVHYSGLNWVDYNNNMSAAENVATIERTTGLLFDAVIAYKPLELVNFAAINKLRVLRYNEMYDVNWTTREIVASGAQLVICHHLNDCQLYQQLQMKPNSPLNNVKFVYIGHCAEKSIFCNNNENNENNKEWDVSLLGCVSKHYPLRQKFQSILPILIKKGYKCYHHPHPGYDLRDAHTDKYMRQMAAIINNSKIVLTDTGITRSRYGKYIEVPMCGTAAICGDLPGDSADDYSYVIKVNATDDINTIINTIEHYLKNDEAREEKVKLGIEFAANYTQEKYAERLLETLKQNVRSHSHSRSTK
jgi:hypothetical protein